MAILYIASRIFQAETSPSIDIQTEVTEFELSPVQFPIVPFLGIIVALWLVSTVYFLVSFARFRLGTHEGWLILESGVIRGLDD